MKQGGNVTISRCCVGVEVQVFWSKTMFGLFLLTMKHEQMIQTLFRILYWMHVLNIEPMFPSVTNNAPVNVNPVPLRLTQGTLMEKRVVCQNPHPAISFHCRNPSSKDLYFKLYVMSE